MFTELNSAQAAPQAVDSRNLSASPATAAPPHQLENLAPDLAADLDPTPADLAALPPDAAAAYVRGWWLIPLRPGKKAPALAEGHPALLGQRRLSARALADYARHGCGFGVMLDPSGLVVVDIEAEGDAGPWAAHAAGGPNVVTTWSNGAHAYYSRPAGAPARRVIKVRGQDGRKLAADVLSKGYAVLPGSVVRDPSKAPYHGTYMAPAAFWSVELPTAPADVLATLAEPEPPEPRAPGLVPLPCDPTAALRAQAVIIGLVEHWCERIGAMSKPKDGRRTAVFAGARAAFELIHHAPELEPWVIARLTDAAHACGLIQTDGEKSALANLENGRRAGLANPLPLPADRPGWTPAAPKSTRSDNVRPNRAAEDIQAAALAALADLPARLDAMTAEHFTRRRELDDGTVVERIMRQRRESVYLIASRVYQNVVESGRPWVGDNADDLGISAGRAGSTVGPCRAALAALGIHHEPADVGRRAGWRVELGEFLATLGRVSVDRGGAPAGGTVHPKDARAKVAKNSPTWPDPSDALVNLGWATSDVVRGARSRRAAPEPPTVTRRVETPEGVIDVERYLALGPMAHRFIGELSRQTADGQAADVGVLIEALAGVMSDRSVREYARRAVELGVSTSEAATAAGPGRPRMLYRLTEATAAAWRSVEERGRAALRLAVASARRRAAEARAVYKTLGGKVDPAALRVGWAKFRERGGLAMERGRPDLGRAAALLATKVKGAAIMAAAAASTPPEWAVESIPPWAFGDATLPTVAVQLDLVPA